MPMQRGPTLSPEARAAFDEVWRRLDEIEYLARPFPDLLPAVLSARHNLIRLLYTADPEKHICALARRLRTLEGSHAKPAP